jgi:ADP-ribose pyrophosphatase
MAWKKISTKKILDHPRLVVYEDQVELPSGEQTDYLYFGRGDASMIIAVNQQGNVLLQKECSYPQRTKLFQFPGGGIEKGEDPLQAAQRELAEEAQLKGTLQQLGWFYINNRRGTHKMFVFVATDLQGTVATPDLEESFEDFWFSPTEIGALIRSNKICNFSTLAAWAMYLCRG